MTKPDEKPEYYVRDNRNKEWRPMTEKEAKLLFAIIGPCFAIELYDPGIIFVVHHGSFLGLEIQVKYPEAVSVIAMPMWIGKN